MYQLCEQELPAWGFTPPGHSTGFEPCVEERSLKTGENSIVSNNTISRWGGQPDMDAGTLAEDRSGESTNRSPTADVAIYRISRLAAPGRVAWRVVVLVLMRPGTGTVG